MVLRTDRIEVTCSPEHGFVIGSLTTPQLGNVFWNPPGASFAPLGDDLGPTGEASIGSFDRGVLAGGWFPMFPSAGPPGRGHDGWMHGEAPRLPWSVTSSSDTHVRARLTTPVSGFLLERELRVSGPVLRVETEAHNVSGAVRSITFGEHPCFLREVFAGGRLVMHPAAARVTSLADPPHASLAGEQDFPWPVATGIDGDAHDVSALPVDADGRHDHVEVALPDGVVDILDASATAGVRLAWDAAAMPYALLWEHFLPGSSPWPGDVFAIEPASAAGRTRTEAIALGHEREVGIGERLCTWMSIEVLERGVPGAPSTA
ncbi:MAG: hypothetical protein JJT89_07120 [Nitriliruptoraceae bacterium]|nr:hypothetical protein [Nitriliruptoraceae bacterium]